MDQVAYFVAMPIFRSDGGELVAGEASKRQPASATRQDARFMSETLAGAVAIHRSSNSASGVFEDALVPRQFDDLPTLDELLRWV